MNEDLQPGEVMENELDKMLRTVIDYLGDSLILLMKILTLKSGFLFLISLLPRFIKSSEKIISELFQFIFQIPTDPPVQSPFFVFF